MQRSTLIAIIFVLGCPSDPAADDEAGSTTSPSTGAELDEGESSASTTDTSTTTTDTTGDEDSSFFVPSNDIINDSCMCDTFAQDCPDGEKCVPFASSGGTWDCVKCVPVLGDHAPGDACSSDGIVVSTDDCDASSWCFTSEGEGTCRAFCTGTADDPQCPPGLNCWTSNWWNITLCLPACDPLLQDCEQGTGCSWSGATFGCAFSPTNLPVGEPCEFMNDCAPGLQCTDASDLPNCAGDSCCSPFCDVGLGDAACDVLPGTVCMALMDVPQGYENVGICVVP